VVLRGFPRLPPVVLVSVLLGVSCAHYQPRPISPTSTLDAFEARRLESPELERWLEGRGGLPGGSPAVWDLHALTLAAFFYHPDLDVARARWGVAEAGRITAGERPNPSVGVLEGYNATSTGISPWIPEAVLDLPVETAGKRGLRISRARTLSEAARLDVLTVAWSVRSRLRRAFVDLWQTRETEDLLARQNELRAEIADLLERQARLGEVSANEVAQARIALDQGRLAALEATRRSARARLDLAAALGVPAEALDGLSFSFDGLDRVETPPATLELRRRALTGRSDILGALTEYEARQQDLQLEIARQYPDLHLGAGYQLDQTDSKWTLGLTLTLPVFHRNQGAIAEAEARRREAAARFLALQTRVIAELDGATVEASAAEEQARAAETLAAELAEREETARRSLDLGEISRLDLLGIELERSTGELARLEAVTRAQRAAGQLEDALQGPLDLRAWALESPSRSAVNEEESNGG
jgi:cobalt-zinc-cadmium efflux system outer membrane protein